VWSLAARLGGGDFCELGRDLICVVGREAELKQGNGRHIEAGLAGAAVHQHGDGDRRAAGFAHDVEALQDASAAGDDVFDDEYFFTGLEREAAPHHEQVVFLFREDVP
jgi:hypothetical protein